MIAQQIAKQLVKRAMKMANLKLSSITCNQHRELATILITEVMTDFAQTFEYKNWDMRHEFL